MMDTHKNQVSSGNELRQILAAPVGLSVVLQGGLFKSNLVNVANHVLHIRNIFKSAQIVVAVSSSDILFNDETTQKVLRPDPKSLGDTIAINAMKLIFSHSEVILAYSALPLPAIKSDIPKTNNNFNLQLAAAKAGLSAVTGLYVLRMRNDFIFTNDSFIDYYAARADLVRKNPTFSKRILISNLFTVNPYLAERMPFHFSDWFHFGLSNDVNMLWQVAPMTFADSVYFRHRSHPAGTNSVEKLIYTRLAVEQHLCFGYYRERLHLDEQEAFNDTQYRELSIQALLDDFIIMHPLSSGVYFDRYQADFFKKDISLACIMADEWDYLAQNRDVSPAKYFEAKIKKVNSMLMLDAINRDLRLVVMDLSFFFIDRIPNMFKSIFVALRRRMWR